MNREGFWSGKRVLVLGCTGFLGTWMVRELLRHGAHTTGLIRNSQRPSDLFDDQLHQHISTARGPATPEQLRRLLSVHEITTVFQLATAWDSPRTKATITTDLLHAVADYSPTTTILVPLANNDTTPKFVENSNPPKLRVGFVNLPTLFGSGQSRANSWIGRVFTAASQNRMLPIPMEPSEPLMFAGAAANCLLDTAQELATLADVPAQGHWATGTPSLMARELYEQLSDPRNLADANIRSTLTWYQEHPIRLGTEVPQSRAA